jgi:hypothetical protein
MSRTTDTPIGFTVMEKLFAIFILIIGVLLVYNTVTSPRLLFQPIFAAGGLVLVILGSVMILAKPQ